MTLEQIRAINEAAWEAARAARGTPEFAALRARAGETNAAFRAAEEQARAK